MGTILGQCCETHFIILYIILCVQLQQLENNLPWKKWSATSGRSRIFQTGRQSQGGGATYYSITFSWKLHENGENWAETQATSEICPCRSVTGSYLHRRDLIESTTVGIQDFPEVGASTLQGAPTYDFAKFFQKLYEIERISLVPPLDPPLHYLEHCCENNQ